jgi:hypothetical protein
VLAIGLPDQKFEIKENKTFLHRAPVDSVGDRAASLEAAGGMQVGVGAKSLSLSRSRSILSPASSGHTGCRSVNWVARWLFTSCD